jgi:hypothetical protein
MMNFGCGERIAGPKMGIGDGRHWYDGSVLAIQLLVWETFSNKTIAQ